MTQELPEFVDIISHHHLMIIKYSSWINPYFWLFIFLPVEVQPKLLNIIAWQGPKAVLSITHGDGNLIDFHLGKKFPFNKSKKNKKERRKRELLEHGEEWMGGAFSAP